MNLLDYIDNVIHLVDRNMKIIFCNKAIEQLSRGKIKRDEIIGKNLFEVFPFLLEKGIDKEYEKVFLEGKPLRTEEWTECHGEKIHTITTKIPIFGDDGKVKNIITIIRDVSELRRLEESLHDIIGRYSSILEFMQEGVAISDADGKLIYANNALASILKKNKDDILGRDITSIVGISKEELDKPSRYEVKIKMNASNKYIYVSTNPLYKDGKYSGSISIILDITERKRAEERVKEALQKEREFKLKTAHYFFNPIAIAKGYMSLLLESMPENEKTNAEKAIFAIERIEKVVMNIVKKGRIVE